MPIDKINRDLQGVSKASHKKYRANEDEVLNQIRISCLDLYLTNNNKTASYDIYRRATMGSDYTVVQNMRSAAMNWFNKPENLKYLEYRRKEIQIQHFNDYCQENGISTKDFVSIKEERFSDMLKMSPAEIREKNYRELEELKDDTDDPQVLAQIIKQQTELMDAKLKDKGEELTSTDKFIMYYLPAPVCDDCPNRNIIEKRYEHLPNVEIEILEEEEDGEQD